MKGTVRALFVASGKKTTPVSLVEVRVAPKGFEGDFHNGTAGVRQILMVSANVLQEFDLLPGALSENMAVDGLNVMSLTAGQRLSVGATILEVTIPCEPCIQMERIRRGLKRQLDGKRGMFAKVVQPGTIRLGDTVSV